jgi:hypothetical protein
MQERMVEEVILQTLVADILRKPLLWGMTSDRIRIMREGGEVDPLSHRIALSDTSPDRVHGL